MTRGAYADRLDPELWDYIDRVNAWYPPDTIDAPMARQREIYDAMCRDFHLGHPPGVSTQDETVVHDSVPLRFRRYTLAGSPSPARVVFYHGGGFVLGGLDSHDDICAEICGLTGFEVLSLDYRLAPEHPHPAAFDDAHAFLGHVLAFDERPVLVVGESAGGNLAAAVLQQSRGNGRLIGQVLIYPSLGPRAATASMVEHADAPLLTTHDLDFYRQVRAAGSPCENDPTFEPLRDDEFSGLPPTIIITAECDPLSGDGEAYRDAILAAGGKAKWIEEPRLVHSFLRARHTVRRAQSAFDHIIGAITLLGDGRWLDDAAELRTDSAAWKTIPSKRFD